MQKVIVNPGKKEIEKGKGAKRLVVFDELGRQIPFRNRGNEINKTTYISRLIKAGDLEVLAAKTEKKKEN